MTATASKPREVKYFEMTGTAAGTQMRLTPRTVKAIQNAAEILDALGRVGNLFPKADSLAATLTEFIENPTA